MAPVFDYGAPICSQCCSIADLEKVLNRTYRFSLGVGRKHPWHQLQETPSEDISCKPRHFGVTYYKKREHRISRRVLVECKKIAEEEHNRNWVHVSEMRCFWLSAISSPGGRTILVEVDWASVNSGICFHAAYLDVGGRNGKHRNGKQRSLLSLNWEHIQLPRKDMRVHSKDTMQGTTVCSGMTQRRYSPKDIIFKDYGSYWSDNLMVANLNNWNPHFHDYQRIHRMSSKSAESTFQCSKERHLNKMELLRKQQKKSVRLEPQYLRDKNRWLVDLSSTKEGY